MALFSRRDLDLLLAPHTRPCISLFMPTLPQRSDAQQNPIRFKNLLTTAESQLLPRYTTSEVRRLVEPLAELSTPEFWRTHRSALATFRSPDFAASYDVPVELPELVVVSDSFHLKPLFRFFRARRRYYALALGQKQARLYEGTSLSLRQVDVPGMPHSLEDVPGTEWDEPFRTRHTAGLGKGGKTGAVVYGHETVETLKKADLATFFSAIDHAVCAMLRDDHAPLVLAGVGYYFPIYREASGYRNLIDEGAQGSFETAPEEQIRSRVWPIVERWFTAREDEALAEYQDLVGRGQATDALRSIAEAAAQGRVRRLFVADDARIWGALDRATGRLAVYPGERRPYDDDVLDDVAESVLVHRGEVLALPRDRMPDGAPVAAIMRW